jgi:hypothetical protein
VSLWTYFGMFYQEEKGLIKDHTIESMLLELEKVKK